MKNDLKNRTKKFAHDCVKLALKLPNTYLGNHIRGQLIRCSTSVAANYRAVCLAQSKASFIAKISIYTSKLVLESNYKKSSLFKRGFRWVLIKINSQNKIVTIIVIEESDESEFWLEFIIDPRLSIGKFISYVI